MCVCVSVRACECALVNVCVLGEIWSMEPKSQKPLNYNNYCFTHYTTSVLHVPNSE